MSDFLRRAVINFLHYNKGLSVKEASIRYEDNRKSIDEVSYLIGEDIFLKILSFIDMKGDPNVRL